MTDTPYTVEELAAQKRAIEENPDWYRDAAGKRNARLLATIEALQGRVAELESERGWNPNMDAAPKDRRLLGFARGEGGLEYSGAMQWATADEAFPRSVDGWFWEFAIRPTHWGYIPTPPQTEEK